jgi:YidC/Oxa1 family membrane protein insertase
MREDNRNLIVAIALSLAILLGWQYFFAAPQAERQRQAAQQQSTQVNPTAPNPPASPSQAGGAGNRSEHAGGSNCSDP